MAKLNITKFAVRAGISRKTIYQYFDKGLLVQGDDKKIDLSNPVNFRFIEDRKLPMNVLLGVIEPPEKPITAKVPTTRKRTIMPGADAPLEKPTTGGISENTLKAFDEVNLESWDPGQFNSSDVSVMKSFEGVLKSQMERKRIRKTLIDRELVKAFIGQIFAIDTSQFRGLGAQVVSDLASIAGVEDPKTILAMEEKITTVVNEKLEHIKRLQRDFLKGLKSE